MKYLLLEDYVTTTGVDKPLNAVKQSIADDFQIDDPNNKSNFFEWPTEYELLVAYKSVGDYGCDSSAWFLLRHRETGDFYEAHGSHCSCYGFEGQWKPEPTTLEYLKSDKFHFSTGGYDNCGEDNKAKARAFIKTLRNSKGSKPVKLKRA